MDEIAKLKRSWKLFVDNLQKKKDAREKKWSAVLYILQLHMCEYFVHLNN